MESKLTEVGAGRGSYTKEQRVTYGYRHGIGRLGVGMLFSREAVASLHLLVMGYNQSLCLESTSTGQDLAASKYANFHSL